MTVTGFPRTELQHRGLIPEACHRVSGSHRTKMRQPEGSGNHIHRCSQVDEERVPACSGAVIHATGAPDYVRVVVLLVGEIVGV